MISGRAGNNTPPLLLLRQMGQLVISASDLEGKNILEILALEIDLVLGSGREIDGVGEGGLLEDLVAAGGEDQTEVVWMVLEIAVVVGGVD